MRIEVAPDEHGVTQLFIENGSRMAYQADVLPGHELTIEMREDRRGAIVTTFSTPGLFHVCATGAKPVSQRIHAVCGRGCER